MKRPNVILLSTIVAVLPLVLAVGCQKSEPEPPAEEPAPAAGASEMGEPASSPDAAAIAQKT